MRAFQEKAFQENCFQIGPFITTTADIPLPINCVLIGDQISGTIVKDKYKIVRLRERVRASSSDILRGNNKRL